MGDDSNIIDIDEHRRSLGKKPSPCRLTFFGNVFNDAAGILRSVAIVTTVHDGDFERAINDVKAKGGIYTRDRGLVVFAPWPFAAVTVEGA